MTSSSDSDSTEPETFPARRARSGATTLASVVFQLGRRVQSDSEHEETLRTRWKEATTLASVVFQLGTSSSS